MLQRTQTAEARAREEGIVSEHNVHNTKDDNDDGIYTANLPHQRPERRTRDRGTRHLKDESRRLTSSRPMASQLVWLLISHSVVFLHHDPNEP